MRSPSGKVDLDQKHNKYHGFKKGNLMNALERFRQEKDKFFKNDQSSPLTPEQKLIFSSLNYYPENIALRLEIAMEMVAPPKTINMITSTGDRRDYLHKAQIRFNVDGQEAVLQVYEDAHGMYFLPFVDATAPQETYGAGRYLEPEELSPGVLLVDFNLAYNPFCAYNSRWSCPIPPHENRIKLRIEAGEKKLF
jgi:uncharacterized protein (DUF1684 family)